MQAYHLLRSGDVSSLEDSLVPRKHEVPRPGPGEALVRVHAASLNYRDILLLQGRYPVPAREAVVPLSDGAGEVVENGAGVSRVAAGDKVTATYFTRWFDGRLTLPLAMRQTGASEDGMLAQYRVIHEDQLMRLPAHLSFEEGATLTCAALTAWSCLTGPRPVLPGEAVLTGGTGGLALFALQFAKVFGARTIALASSAAKAKLLRELGADEVIPYREIPDWDAEVRRLTGGAGADHIVDSVGVATLERSLKAAAFGGEIAFPGAFASPEATFDPRALAGRLVNIRRVAVGSRAAFEAMNRAITQHQLRPVIGRIFDFHQAHTAYRHYAAQQHVGKVVISLS